MQIALKKSKSRKEKTMHIDYKTVKKFIIKLFKKSVSWICFDCDYILVEPLTKSLFFLFIFSDCYHFR